MALTLHGTVSDNEVILSRHNSKPLIINGDMNIFQRGTSVTSVTSAGCKIADRMYFEYGSLGTWTIAQSTDVPTGQGFKYSQKYDCTTADASPASGDYLLPIEYHFEGQDLQLLKKGTSSAEPITVAVWLKSNLTGNFNMEIWDRENDRQIHAVCNIGSANTWTKFVKTFPGDTTGTLTADNAHRFSIGIWGDSGSNFRGGTVSTSWGANVTARYYFKQGNEGGFAALGSGVCESTSSAYIMINLPSTMRASPSVSFTGNITLFDGDTFNTSSSIGSTQKGTNCLRLSVTANSSVANGHGATLHIENSSSFVEFASEI